MLAARYDLPGGAGSDAHEPDGIGAAYLEMPDFEGPQISSPRCATLPWSATTGRTQSATPAASPERLISVNLATGAS